MAQEYLKEYIRLTRNENLEEPPSVEYNQNPNQYRFNAPPKITYEPQLVKAETHRFQTTHEQPPPPPPNINTGVVAPAVTRPYKPSPSLVVNGYEYQNDTIYDQEPSEQSSTIYGRSRNWHQSAAAASSTQKDSHTPLSYGYINSRNWHLSAAAASSTKKNSDRQGTPLYGQNYNSATTNNSIKTDNKKKNRP